MPGAVINQEVAATLSQFFQGGSGPTHLALTEVFDRHGLGHVAPYDPAAGLPNKVTRVRMTLVALNGRQADARRLVDDLLADMRAKGLFDPNEPTFDEAALRKAQGALARTGWLLTDGGVLKTAGPVDFETGGRAALDEQLDRLNRAEDDPALLLGSAKELLEAVAKFVLEELGLPVSDKASFDELWFHARDRLGIHPKSVSVGLDGADNIKAILQSSWTIAEQTNKLRCKHGTGHGRTLPTGVSTEMALLVVREAASVAAFTLATLDRHVGR